MIKQKLPFKKRKTKIAIIGPYPPPYGGISIFIKRFCQFLEKKRIKKAVYSSTYSGDKKKDIVCCKFKKTLIRLIFDKSDIIHSNDIGIKSRILIPLFRLSKKKTILSIHGNSLEKQIRASNLIIKRILICQIKQYNHIIVVNPDIKEFLVKLGVNKCKISVIPAFIFPATEETDITKLPESIHEIRNKHSFLITANASKISFCNRQDLYGIDLSIELMKKLVNSGYKNIGFIYVIPDIGDYAYYEKMKSLVKEHNLYKHFYFYTKPVAYPAVINICDLFIRPTNTDGYGISVQEAIIQRKPAIASNVCKRPKGTTLFRNRDINDLYDKTKYCLEHYSECQKQLDGIQFENNAVKILEIYKRLLNE
jgi:glycosyltransferase involved in cell wall biosynthesis